MNSPIATAAADMIYLMAQATDDLDVELLQSLFVSDRTVMIDVSGHLGLPPQEFLPEEVAQQMLQAISGFTATHHIVTNPIIVFDPTTQTRARATSYKTAYHCIQESEDKILSATARGKWDMDLELLEDSWRIRSFTVTRTVPLLRSELELWSLAKTRVSEGRGRMVKDVATM